MFYEAIGLLDNAAEPKWPEADAYINAVQLPQKSPIQIPVINTNTLFLGVTGYGKTTAMKSWLDAAITTEDDPYMVFLDVKKDWQCYRRPDDKVITYSDRIGIQSGSYFKWNMIKEFRQADEPDAMIASIAGILSKELYEDSNNRFFVDAAKYTFIGFNKVIVHCFKNNPTNRQVVEGMKSMTYKQLIDHLLLYPENRNLVRDYFGYHGGEYKAPKRLGDIMSFLTDMLEKFMGLFCSDGEDTIQEYMEGKYGHRLFLVWDFAKKDVMNDFMCLFLKQIIDEKLSQKSNYTQHLTMVMDEGPSLGSGFGLMEAVTVGRGCGLSVILSSQSYEKLYCLAPKHNGEHITRSSLAGFSVIVTFHPGDGETIDILQRLFGTRRKVVYTMPLSRYGQPGCEYVTEPCVSDEEFASLKMGECYVKIKAAAPVRVKMIRK